MLEALDLRDFKAFNHLGRLDIKPLTVLCGINSCGKSSILQSLLLLKQSFNAEPKRDALILDGKYIQVPHVRDITFNLPQSAAASIQYVLYFRIGKKHHANLTFEIRQKRFPTKASHAVPVVNRLSWTDNDRREHHIRLRKFKFRWPKSARIDISPPPRYQFAGKGEVTYENFIPLYLVMPIKKVVGKLKRSKGFSEGEVQIPIRMAARPLGRLIEQLKSEISNLRYLGPLRAKPQRIYPYFGSPHFELDDDGGNAAHVFWTRRMEKVSLRGKKMTLQDAVDLSLQIMGLPQRIKPSRAGTYIYQLKVDTLANPQKDVTIADVGFGFSQLLPIILRIVLSPAKSLVLFEQPEIHLHPSCRGNLADLLLAGCTQQKRFIVETHSSEFISKLRLRAIEDPTVAERINLVFIESPREEGTGSNIQQLTLDHKGMFDAWPEGFCDESEKLSRAIMNARLSLREGSG